MDDIERAMWGTPKGGDRVNATNKILSAEQVHTINAYPSISDSRLLAASHEALRSENRALREALTALVDALDDDSGLHSDYYPALAAARALLGVTESGPPPT